MGIKKAPKGWWYGLAKRQVLPELGYPCASDMLLSGTPSSGVSPQLSSVSFISKLFRLKLQPSTETGKPTKIQKAKERTQECPGLFEITKVWYRISLGQL